MARGLFTTGFTVAEVLAIQQRAKELLLEGKTIMNWNDADTSVASSSSCRVDQVLDECAHALRVLDPDHLRPRPDRRGIVHRRPPREMNRFQSIALRWLPPVLVPKAWGSTFEAANWSPRRGSVPGASPTDARQELTSSVRTELVRKSRYLHKNSGFVRELVANMAIYSTGDGIRVQAQSGDAGWNRAAEEYFALWSARCEVTRRFSFEECQALVCRGIDIDGEYFVHKTRDAEGEPRLQLIESHRIGDEFGSKETIDGVGLDAWGAPVVLPGAGGQREGSRPAGALGPPPVRTGVGRWRARPPDDPALDQPRARRDGAARPGEARGEGQLRRGPGAQDGPRRDRRQRRLRGRRHGGAGEPSDPVSLQRIIGGKLVALKPEESLDSFQPNRPSPTFTGFLEHLRRDSALGMIPFEFAADSSKIGGAGVRLIVAKADRRFSFRQMILERRLLRPVWAFVIGDAIERGLICIPWPAGGRSAPPLRSGSPWIPGARPNRTGPTSRWGSKP